MRVKPNFNEITLFDGAMGSMLQSKGMEAGQFSESYNIQAPDVIYKIHKEYIVAGANIITTNTFGASKYKLKGSGLDFKEVIKKGVKIARSAAGDKLVALDIGPLGQLMKPYGTLSFEAAYEAFKEQMTIGYDAGADVILIETMSDVYETKAAILAARENSDLPIVCTMTFQQDGRTLTGTDAVTMVNIVQNLGVAALGINCSIGPKEMLPVVKEILTYSKVPVIVQPNAGLPKVVAGKTTYNVGPEEFGRYILQMAKMGATIMGGCCGTTPAHIQVIKNLLSGFAVKPRETRRLTMASSSTKTVVLGAGVKIIGERINPTGKKKLKIALKNHDMDYVLREALDQKEAGAHILDINMGLPEIDEKAFMVRAISEIQSIIDLPLQIDSARPDVLEEGARLCNGRPIINSINGEEKIMKAIFPIVKKYGCLVIALTLDEKGIPKTAEERLKIAKRIINKGAEYGIGKENIIVDCLVLTASAQQAEVKETIRAVSLIKETLGVKTTLGISNISFGLPAREVLNRTFLAMALTAGLDAPILDPMSDEIMNTVRAYELLWNLDKDGRKYIKKFTDQVPSITVKNKTKTNSRDLKKAIIDGMKEDAAAATEELLSKINPLKIVNEYLVAALDVVGEKYEKGEIFLPQLIQSAETVKTAFSIIKDNMGVASECTGSATGKGKIIIATVKGDIHDIGKNIVKILLENYGFDVNDLGKDVPIEKVVEEVKKNNVTLVGLSALMTTTVKTMEDTIKALRVSCPECKVMVGGAVLNKEYARQIDADYYAKDAREGVKIAQKLLLHQDLPNSSK